MKNLIDITLEVLSNEELMAVRGGDAPIKPIIIPDSHTMMSYSTIHKNYK